MLDAIKGAAAGLVDHLGRSFKGQDNAYKTRVHPLDDPAMWERVPPHRAPSDVDVEKEQAEINRIYGTTREGQPIMKLVWNGDRTYWEEFYDQWDSFGEPLHKSKFPFIRYKTRRDQFGNRLQDVFPPRWLILCRVEPEQYADDWAALSYIFDPVLKMPKPIRPTTPPPVFWLWFATIGHHTDTCCATKRRNYEHCYGTYARPAAIYETLYNQRKADEAAEMHSPFAKIDAEMMADIGDEHNGYRMELANIQAERDIFAAHPHALLGIAGSQVEQVDTAAKADAFIKDHFDREIEELGSKL